MKEIVLSELAGLQRVHVGPLSPHIHTFGLLLTKKGYARSTIEGKIRLVADFSRWLHRKELGVNELNEQAVVTFLEHRRSLGRRAFRGNRTTLQTLLNHLRDKGATSIPAPVIDNSTFHQIESGFIRYLSQERGLSQATVVSYLPLVHLFLSDCFDRGAIYLDKLRPYDVTGFFLRYVHTVSPGRAKLMGTALRSFFRYLHLHGEIAIDLAASVPTPGGWRLSELPKSLEPEQVECLLESCDQSTTCGQRDYTILLLLSRLGLRAGEIVAMTLDDIDWEAGELIIRGKGSRQDRLPIPHDVGEALATYLQHGRPRSWTRRVFIRIKAPHQGFSSSVAVCNIVQRALAHAKLHPARKGAHLLRHSLANKMLRSGASLVEIGEILRHRLPSTTEIYTKVDMAALTSLAQPWPGGEI